MAEPIDRKALKEKLKAFYGTQDGKILSVDAIAALSAIDEAEVVCAESVRPGRWVKHKEEALVHWDCSECGIGFLDDAGLEKLKYCPNCGAKMNLEA